MAQMITRCPACGTRFKVVPDQLRMSQGWVRCGHCAEIFDAARQMAEAATPAEQAPGRAMPPLDAAALPAAPAPEPAEPVPAEPAPAELAPTKPLAAEQGASRQAAHAPSERAADDDVPLEVGLAEYMQAQAIEHGQDSLWMPELHRASTEPVTTDAVAPGPSVSPRLVVKLAAGSGPLSARMAVPDAGAMPLPQRPAVEAPLAPPAPPRVVAAAPVRPPVPVNPAHAELSFLREAADAAPQTSLAQASGPGRRMFWAVGGALALLLLVWQVAVHERDRLAASAPGLRPLLGALCAPLGCSVQALRRIDAVVIDGSSFQVLGERSYRLSLTLRNRASHQVAVPAVALSLTDIAEQPVVRRVLLPQDFGTPPDALQAHGEWAASVELQVAENAGAARVVGYRIDPFYP